MEAATKAKILKRVATLLDEIDASMTTVDEKVNTVNAQLRTKCQPYINKLQAHRRHFATEYKQFAEASGDRVDLFYTALQARARSFSKAFAAMLGESVVSQDDGVPKYLNVSPPMTDIGHPNPALIVDYQRALEARNARELKKRVAEQAAADEAESDDYAAMPLRARKGS